MACSRPFPVFTVLALLGAAAVSSSCTRSENVLEQAARFPSKRTIISDFEEWSEEREEWIGNRATLEYIREEDSPSGKGHLRITVAPGEVGGIEKTGKWDFSRHHFQFWIKGRSLNRTDMVLPAYHSELKSYIGLRNYWSHDWSAYLYFYSDPCSYTKYRLCFPSQYNGWFHVPLHRGDSTRVDTGRGVNWSNVTKIRFEFEGRNVPFEGSAVRSDEDLLSLSDPRQMEKIRDVFHTGSRVRFSGEHLPCGLKQNVTYYLKDCGEDPQGEGSIYNITDDVRKVETGPYINLACDNCTGGTVQTMPEIELDGFEAVETIPLSFITLRFDDNYLSTYEIAWPIMERCGFRGVAPVVTQNDTNEGFKFCLDCERKDQLSYEHIRRLQEEGWDIISHTHFHFALGDQLNSGRPFPGGTVYGDAVRAAGCWCCWSEECVQRELYLSRNTLEAEGITKGARFMAVPFGQDSAAGDVFWREVPRYYSLVTSCEPLSPMGLPLTSPYVLGIAPLHLRGMLEAIDRVCEYGGWLTLLFHNLSSPRAMMDFKQVMDHIRRKQRLSRHPLMVVTFSDLYDEVIARTQTGKEVLPLSAVEKPTVVHSYPFTPTLGEAGCLLKLCARDRAVQVRLPHLARAKGREFIFQAMDLTHPVTIVPVNGEEIEGGLTVISLAHLGEMLKVSAEVDGDKWNVHFLTSSSHRYKY